MTIADVNDLIKNRRSVFPKMYSTDLVDDEIIEQMLENANWAPTHRFTEPWRFTVFKGEGLQRLAEFQSSLYKQVSVQNGNFDEKKFLKLLNQPMKASHIIAISMRRDPEKSVPEVEELSAVAMAVQNMYLTATAYGIGCYWGTGGITYYEEAKEFFGLSAEDKFMGFLYVGHIDGELKGKGYRKPIVDKVNWVV
jgi:nitroreductase